MGNIIVHDYYRNIITEKHMEKLFEELSECGIKRLPLRFLIVKLMGCFALYRQDTMYYIWPKDRVNGIQLDIEMEEGIFMRFNFG